MFALPGVTITYPSPRQRTARRDLPTVARLDGLTVIAWPDADRVQTVEIGR